MRFIYFLLLLLPVDANVVGHSRYNQSLLLFLYNISYSIHDVLRHPYQNPIKFPSHFVFTPLILTGSPFVCSAVEIQLKDGNYNIILKPYVSKYKFRKILIFRSCFKLKSDDVELSFFYHR